MAEHIRFVIVSCPRTGSTHLVEYLDSIAGVCCLSEIFRSGEVLLRHRGAIASEIPDIGLRDADPLGWLERVEQEFAEFGWFGFKLFPQQQTPLLRLLCADRRWKKIYLWRDNFLDQCVSFLLAKSHFEAKEWGRVLRDRRLSVRPDLIVGDLATIEMSYLALEQMLALAHQDDVFALEYADLGRATIMRQLLAFLGLSRAAIGQTLRAMRNADNPALVFDAGHGSRARLENYAEIRDVLQQTRYRRFAP